MTKKSIINRNEINELKNNPTTRVPIVLCLDTSGSMAERNRNGARKIDELTNGIRMFYESVKADDLAAYAADVAIVTFADQAEIRQTYAAAQSSGMEAIHRPMHRHDRPAYCCQIRLLKNC